MDEFVLGDRELDVMAVLWELSSGTVTEVRERLPVELAYTTVLTILRNLEAKGFIAHEAEGKAHRYFPRVAEQAARRSALARLVEKLFRGSPEELLAQLVSDHDVSADDLRELSRQLPSAAAARGAGRGADPSRRPPKPRGGSDR